MTSETPPAPAERRSIFAPLGPNARPLHPALALLFTVLSLVFAFLVAMVSVIVFLIAVGAFANVEPGADPMSAVGAHMAPMFAVLMLTLFPAMALAAIFWCAVVEKRSLASMGFSGPAKLFRYGRGLFGGAALALLLMAIAGGLALLIGADANEASPEAAAETFHPERLMQAALLIPLAITGLIFFVQSASEEILFRGWLMSSLASRVGLGLAIGLSSVMFGLFHIDRAFVGGPVVGLLVVAGTGAVGLAFAVWALREGGIFGVMGAHGGFNATLILTELARLAASGDEPRAFSDIILSVQEGMLEALNDPTAIWGVAAQIVVFVALAMILAPGLQRGRG